MAAANATVALNSTANGTTISPLPSPSASSLSVLDILQNVDFMMLELKLLCGAMGIIYLGAHASLRRPPSAKASKSKSDKTGKKRDEDEPFAQGLELMDAIIFPFMAAFMLVGLYYLIQWLNDPAILNKILRYYMSTMSIASLVTIYAHGLELSTSVVFPKFWRGTDGALRKVDQKRRTVTICDDVGNTLSEQPGAPTSSSPLPGILALLTPSEKLRTAVWDARDLLTRHWVLKFYMHGMGQETVHVKFAQMMALFMSLGTAIVYFATSWSSLSNMLGYGMCYCSFLILSPTDFLTGSLVLSGLFFYDIFMVFYTPYMVTVATTLDVPIKLTFEAADKKSILGLGDIVVPGILIGWALRLDLWIHYLNKIKREPVEVSVKENDNDDSSSSSGQAVIEKRQIKHMEIKAPYINAKGNWGERLWTSRGSFSRRRSQELLPLLPVELAASNFSKTYFHAAMAGYGLGMLVTLAMLMVFKRGQPALLYLVPGVLGSLVVTSLWRGEFKKLLWTYTENGSLDVVDVVVDLDEKGNVIKMLGKLKDGKIHLIKEEDDDDAKKKKKKKEEEEGKKIDGKDEEDKKDAEKKGHRVFFLSLEVPSDDEADED